MGADAVPLTIALFAVLASRADEASGPPLQTIGCSILGELTRRHTLRRLQHVAGKSGDWRRSQVHVDSRPQACDQTAAAVSRGFSVALDQLDMPVHWSALKAATGCTSRDIALCHPSVDWSGAAKPPQAAGVVGQTWREVRHVVSAYMPLGSHSDLSYFTSGVLQSAYDSTGRPQAGSIAIEPAPGSVW